MISAEDSIPKKSDNYLYAQSHFFIQFNDVDFFVEDSDQEELYFVILSRLFPDIKIEKIFPLGGKENVINHLRDAVSERSAYIVDKDFDDLLGLVVRNDKLFYLDRYCIENYLLQEDALIAFVVSEFPKMKRREVANTLQWNTFYADLLTTLLPLFGGFLFAKKFDLDGVKNTGSAPESFTQQKRRYCIDQDAINKYRDEICQFAGTMSVCQDVQRELDRATAQIGSDLKEIERHICGKFLLRLVYHYLGASFGVVSVAAESFTYRLAEYCKVVELDDLRARVSAALRPRSAAVQ